MIIVKKKLLAQELRRKGFSIAEIANKLRMQKSGSISKWCRDISLTPEQINRLSEKQKSRSYIGRMKSLEIIRKARIKETKLLQKQGLREIGSLDTKELLVSGVAMYWSEGYTYSGGEQVGFTNSDPRMILFILRWFKEICKVSNDRISLQVKINEIHKDRTREIESYWSGVAKIPLGQFNKTILIKAKARKIYPNSDSYYGTLRITIKRSTNLRRKINGWIEGLCKNM